jgi:formiminotetrahydrofolate cyclodeaminase
MYDSTHTIAEFLSATAAKQPVPGGGSVTALVGALGAAVGEMVVNYSVGKKSLEPFAEELQAALGELTRARNVMLQLMVEDQLAYEAMTALRKLPHDSAERKDKWAPTLLACIRAPQAVAATSVAILHLCDRLVNIVNHYLLSDLAVCADLSMATTRCALYNVRINARELTDANDRAEVERRSFDLLANAATLIQHVSPRIWDRESHDV